MKRVAEEPPLQLPQGKRYRTEAQSLVLRSVRCLPQRRRPPRNYYSLVDVFDDEATERFKSRNAAPDDRGGGGEQAVQEPIVNPNPPSLGPGRPSLDADKLTTSKSKSKRKKSVVSGSKEVFAENKMTPRAATEALMKEFHPSATQWRTIFLFLY